ncbi:MAG: hypothetical protein ETSY1_07335 [Candidatus Entotheonella factor]|uniref:N-acetyltransferase domain-containing protein n=1 Tax=Entotheonella factor TaxID=1429438 RepID=W4LUB3_ENTF1|nr:MAG: hypothetical protein ETSY1_07335 [Candidatus Entotheonella factor]
MKTQAIRGLLISDFNLESFSGYLNNDEESPHLETMATPYSQVMQVLMSDQSTHWASCPDFALLWTRPESVIESFNQLLQYEQIPTQRLLDEVDAYASAVLNLQNKVNHIFLPTWVFPSYHRGFGMLDMKNERGIANALMRMNLRLADDLGDASNIYLLNTQKWVENVGKAAYNPKLWYMGKIAFGNGVFKEVVKDIKAALRGLQGQAKKLILVDLDDTLWGGIVGDVGWEHLQLGGHDYMGEAFVEFQHALKALMNRGLLLGIVSKNEESVALEAIDTHPEMVLRSEDFVGWKINWQDKAQNVADLVASLNLGLQSVVFIDDNPVERARVREALPEVLVPDWPEDKTLYTSALQSLHCFDTPSLTKEDLERTKMYVSERQRSQLMQSVGSLEDWLKSLAIQVDIETLNTGNIKRTTQLLNKTNQLNLTTRRLSEHELELWVDEDHHHLWTFRVSDKFGDSGLTGIISLEVEGQKGKIVDFILSCRVMGRNIEETMLYTVINHAKSLGLSEVYAQYIQTSKNKPCLDFWKRSSFTDDNADYCFRWNMDNEYLLPDCISVNMPLHSH